MVSETISGRSGYPGGALITADISLAIWKEVLAVPGRLDAPESAGSNQLIAQGASIFLHQEQLLPEKSKQEPLSQNQVPIHHKSEKMSPRTNGEKELLRLIQDTSGSMPVSIEQIINKLRFSLESTRDASGSGIAGCYCGSWG